VILLDRVELSSAVPTADELDLGRAPHTEHLDLRRCRSIIDLVPPGTFPPPGRERVTLVEEQGSSAAPSRPTVETYKGHRQLRVLHQSRGISSRHCERSWYIQLTRNKMRMDER
jgi:hypothetical protein